MLTIREDYDPSLPAVHGSSDQLVQVFLNLAKNAAEAMKQAEGSGELLFTTAFRPGVRLSVAGSSERISLPLEVCIHDTGPGVPDELLPHIFEPFVYKQTFRPWPWPCPCRQDRARPWRRRRMQAPATPGHNLPRASALDTNVTDNAPLNLETR